MELMAKIFLMSHFAVGRRLERRGLKKDPNYFFEAPLIQLMLIGECGRLGLEEDNLLELDNSLERSN